MQELTAIVQAATAAIGLEYLTLPIYGSEPVYRERVYCYELYHQMRSRWPEGTPLFLNGEVDKQKHPYFGDGRFRKPDLLVHVPGQATNHAAIEAKSNDARKAGIRKDILTLNAFREIGYERALYLMYGLDTNDARSRVLGCGATPQQLDALELWVHTHAHTAAQKVHL